MRTHYSTTLVLALGTLILAGAGCSANNYTTPPTNTVKSNADTEEINTNVDATIPVSSIRIIKPLSYDAVGTSLDMTVDIDGFTLAPDSVEGGNVDGEGHYHIWVDGNYYGDGIAKQTTIENLTPGDYEIKVSLQNNDHTDLNPPVNSEPINLTVVAE